MQLYLGNVNIDRRIFTMEDEYKVVCALSNSATFDDLEWLRTPVSRSQYSLKADISQRVHVIHYIFGSSLGFQLGRANVDISGSLDGVAVARNPCVSWAFLFQNEIDRRSFVCNPYSTLMSYSPLRYVKKRLQVKLEWFNCLLPLQ